MKTQMSPMKKFVNNKFVIPASTPYSLLSQGQVSQGQASQGQVSQGQASQGQASQGQASQG